MHALLTLHGGRPAEEAVLRRAAGEGLALTALSRQWHDPAAAGMHGLVIGYATAGPSGYPTALSTLSRVLA